MNGGSESVFFQERDYLINHGDRIFDFSMHDDKNFESEYASSFIPNIDFRISDGAFDKIKKGFAFIHSSEAVKKLGQLLQKEEVEIAHLHNIYHQLTPSIIPVLKKHGVRVVMTLHDYKLICPSYLALSKKGICVQCEGHKFWNPFLMNCQKSRSQGLLLSLEAFWHKWKGSYDSVDLFISPSQFLSHLMSMRIPVDKIKILHNGIDVNSYIPEYDDEGYILYFGRLSEEKGINTLLKAHAKLNRSLPLKVAGTGPLLKTMIGLYPDVEFVGYQNGEALSNLIAKAAFVVVPSEWYENCSMVILESMAYGKAVIGSNIGGIPEQIEDGKTGLLFETGSNEDLSNKMSVLASDKELRVRFGKAARIKLENKYSLGEHCKELMKIYEELISS